MMERRNEWRFLFDQRNAGRYAMIDSQFLAGATAVVGAAAIAFARLRPSARAKIVESVGYSLLLVAAGTYIVKVLKL